MHYMIDFDKWLIHARHKDGDVLNKYGEDNDLDMGMEIVSNAEELCLILDTKEMGQLYKNLTHKDSGFVSENEAAESLWIAMGEHTDDIREVINGELESLKKVGDAFNDELDDEWDEPEEPVKAAKPVKPVKKKTVRASQLVGMTFCIGSKSPRAGTTFAILTDFIEENMGEAGFDELVKEFIRTYKPSKSNATVDEKFASGYIRGAFSSEYIEESL